MQKLSAILPMLLLLNGCVGLYKPVAPQKPSDQSLSCDDLHSEFKTYQNKKSNIKADATAITGNRYTEYLILPLYFLYPPLLIGPSGGPTHKVSEAERSYMCRQQALLSVLTSKGCELKSNEKYFLKSGLCSSTYE